MIPQAPHSLGLVPNSGQPFSVEPIGLDHCDCDVAVQAVVVGEVDAFAAALAQEALNLVASADERGGKRRSGLRRRRAGWSCAASTAELQAGWIRSPTARAGLLRREASAAVSTESGVFRILLTAR